MPDTYYLLKIKGSDKIADHLQIRDKDFTLVVYCRINNLKKAKELLQISEQNTTFEKLVSTLEYGLIKEYKLKK